MNQQPEFVVNIANGTSAKKGGLPPPPTDVYKKVASTQGDKLLAEMDVGSRFPHWLRYLLYQILGTSLFAIPAVFIYLTSNKSEYFGTAATNAVKSISFSTSVILAIFYFSYLVGLIIVALIPFIINIAEGLTGTSLLAHRIKTFLKNFLTIRYSFARVVAVFPTWIVSQWVLELPHWAPQLFAGSFVFFMVSFFKSIAVQRIAVMYHSKYHEFRLRDNQICLACIKRLKKHFLPNYKGTQSRSPIYFTLPGLDSVGLGEYHPDAESMSASKAEDFGEALASEILKNLRKDSLEKGDLAFVVGKVEDSAFFDLLDVDQNGDLTRKELVQGITNVYIDRDRLAKMLGENKGVIQRLDVIAGYGVVLLSALLLIPLFDLGSFSQLIFQTQIVAIFYFFFGDLAGRFFTSVIFVFLTHPFDSGDNVMIDNKPYTVRKIGLWYSSLYGAGRRLVYQRNYDLSRSTIINVNRSGSQSEEFETALSSATTNAQLVALEERINKFLATNRRDYEGFAFVKNLKLVNKDAFTITMEYRHKSNFVDSALRNRRNVLFMNYFKDSLTMLDIKLAPFSYDLIKE